MWKEIVVIIFVIITGINWAYWQTSSTNMVTPADASFNLFVQILGTGVTILVLDQFWFAEERRKWQKIKDKVNNLLADEISDIFADISLILIPPRVFIIESEDSTQQIERIESKNQRVSDGGIKQTCTR